MPAQLFSRRFNERPNGFVRNRVDRKAPYDGRPDSVTATQFGMEQQVTACGTLKETITRSQHSKA
jgi:hypothetical protein